MAQGDKATLALVGQPQPEFQLSWGTERINACANTDAIYINQSASVLACTPRLPAPRIFKKPLAGLKVTRED